MTIKSLSEFVSSLENENELIRIKSYVNPELEICEIADRMMKSLNGGKALLFENTGTDFPLLINHYGSDKRLFMALGISSYDEPGEKIDKLFTKMINAGPGFKSAFSVLSELKTASKWIPQKSNGKGKCQEVVYRDPDLDVLPILKTWPFDGGKFFTLPVVITVDPETGMRNVGMYRMQVFDKNTTGMHWHLHKGGAAHFKKYKELGKKMPVSVVLGGDPVITYCATAPLPENIDEFILAGFLRNKPVKLVKSITNNIYVPASSDFVIEGYIDPNEDFVIEGPFGDHTGFYSLADYYPNFHITCITHRRDAIYPATIVGIPPMEDYYIGKASERIFLKPIQIALAPEVVDIRLPDYGVAHNLVLLKAKVNYNGQSLKIMNALLGAGQMMFSKVIICFNETINIQNDEEVLNAIEKIENLQASTVFTKGPADVLDHASYKYTFGGKLLIDASDVYLDKSEVKKDIVIDKIANPEFVKYQNSVLVLKDLKSLEKKSNSIINKYQALLGDSIIKIIVFIDDLDFELPINLIPWYVLNNIDPSHDCFFQSDVLIINAYAKTHEKEGFVRDWPNIVKMDEKTIKKIDEIWSELTGQDFVCSPSLKTKSLSEDTGAIWKSQKINDSHK